METIIPLWLKKHLNEKGAEQIEIAVRNAEQKTAAEIVPLLVSKSSITYPEFKYGYVLCGLAAFLTVNPLFLLVIYGLHKLNRKILKDYCKSRALVEFSKLGLSNTLGQTGVLLMISVEEKQVVILADKGIHDLIPSNSLEKIVNQLTPKIRTSSLADGIEQALNQLAEVCSDVLPRHQDDKNELNDRLVIKE